MYFRSLNDLNLVIAASLAKIPKETQLIVGIPRSGLLCANLIALHLNLPFTDLEGFLIGRILQPGQRLQNASMALPTYNNVIVIDDSVLSGTSIRSARSLIVKHHPNKNLLYGAVFSSVSNHPDIDFYFDVCQTPRIFEWNIMHHYYLQFCCLDLDGVLCVDPTEDQNDDGEKYESFILNAPALYRPTRKLGNIVTNRLEKYRKITETWLFLNNISYSNLVMCDLPTKEARVKANRHAEFKANIYLLSDSLLFIESSIWQARKIADLAKKPVYCTENRQMYYPTYNSATNFEKPI